MKNIYLIGMMGSGKSAAAGAAAAISPLRALDLDAAIVSDAGLPITEIFAQYGEEYFRALESNVLYDVHHLRNLIVATGGGIVLRPANVDMMRESGLVVYLERDPNDIIETIDASTRPLLAANPANVHRIYEERRHLYETAAHVTVHNNATIEHVAQCILELASES